LYLRERAAGTFVDVYVDEKTRKPVSVPEGIRTALSKR